MKWLEIKPLNEDLQKVAIEELGEVPARIPADLLALKSWIQIQPHLKARTDDQFLIQFLRGSKYSLEKAKEKIDHYFTLKTKYSDLFLTTDVDDPNFRRHHKHGACLLLPTPLNENGPRIMFHRYTYDPKDFTMGEIIRYGSALTEIMMLNDPYACISGMMLVFDFANATTAHLMALTPVLIKKLISFYVKTLPLRIKAICLFNLSPYAEQITKMLVSYAPEKMKQRMESLQIKSLNEDLQKVAIEELGEVPARIPEDLLALKSWIQKQQHLKARTDDQFLIQFLRGSKYSLEKAKEKIDHYFTLKTKYSDLFLTTDVDDPNFRRHHKHGSCLLLPTPLNEIGPRIMFHRYTYDAKDFTMGEIMRYGSALTEIMMLNDPYACIYGMMLVFDFANATTAHLMLLTPVLIKKLISFYEKTLPLRIKAICLFNLSPYAEQITKMLITYTPEKIKQRIFFCGKDIDSLAQQFPRKYFPVEYGGENGSLDQICSEYNKVWDDHREYFQQNAAYGTDERLRFGKKIQLEEEFGYGGSFRKIQVD